ncbi:MAG TPA: LysR substrate-binding domain-containing protein, partial [Devosia sp.]|nr:LysR substrate-binding domain-containing protein [Devosia sp.]
GALSKQVRQLEQTLGFLLFERTKREVRITRGGQTYVNAVRPLLLKLERTTNAVIEANQEKLVLNCAVLPSFAAHWLAPRLVRFAAVNPRLALNCRAYYEPFNFDEEPMDIAIHVGRPNWPGTSAVHLFDEVLVAVSSPAYRDRLELVEPADIARATLIHNAYRSALWHVWLDSLALDIEHPFGGYALDDFISVAAAAENGLGVALIPEFCIREQLASGRLVSLFDHALRNAEAYYLVVPTAKENDPLIQRFSDWIGDEAAAAHRGSGNSSR